MRAKILLVEDDANLRELLRYNLEGEGFATATAQDGRAGLEKARQEAPDLILLDWMLPSLSGLEVCTRLKQNGDTAGIPIVMLTVKDAEEDRLKGLEAGADDYVTKPFSPKELFARIKTILRRHQSGPIPQGGRGVLVYGDLALDIDRHKVTRGGRRVHLGPTEFRLLRHFMENPARVFSREQLVGAIWGETSRVRPRTVDQYILRLRHALTKTGEEDPIRTVRSAGYSLDVAAENSV